MRLKKYVNTSIQYPPDNAISRHIEEAGTGRGLLTSINQHCISIQVDLETTQTHKAIILRKSADYTNSAATCIRASASR